MAANEVKIGSRHIEIEAFSAFKALEASTMLADIFEEVPELLSRQAKLRDDWLSDNTLKMDRATAEMRYDDAARVSENAWQASDNVLRLPADPGAAQQIVNQALVPVIFKKARDRAIDLCALVLTSNETLEEADQGAGEVDVAAATAETKKYLLHHGRPEQLVDVVSAAWEVLQSQLGPKLDEMRNLWTELRGAQKGATSPDPRSTEPSDERDSSSRSRGSRRGRAPRSSTASRGAKSASSAAA